MADTVDSTGAAPIPMENVQGIGVAGPPVKVPEEKPAGENAQASNTVQRETAEYAQGVGENIDVEA
jgi:hypothetical protein